MTGRPGERTAVLLINFGEPTTLTLDVVEPYLQRIFLQNFDLEHDTIEAATARAAQLTARRAPALLEDYRAIGGSPLNAQADAQAGALARELERRGRPWPTYSAFQFTPPLIADRMEAARADGVDRLIALPVYPICGRSTTVAALAAVRRAAAELAWDVPLTGISGWHHDPAYTALRADGIRAFVAARALDLEHPDTLLYFSVHGTPIKYLDEGNRYDRYVHEHTARVARDLGVGDRYAVGFQNHAGRGIAWTSPDNERLVPTLAERHLVIVPIAFMHEQSETLAELDADLRALVEETGKTYHRVPVPHDDPRFVSFLADLVERVPEPGSAPGEGLAPCACAPLPDTWCTNGARSLPPSPFAAGPPARV